MSGIGQWRSMRADDIPAVSAISDAVHGPLTESADIFAERLSLYPQGCLIFHQDGSAQGYLISHPWVCRNPVPLDALIGSIPDRADTLYVHDLALMPETRGLGSGKRAVEALVRLAGDVGYHGLSLVAVNGADSFWAAQGFVPVDDAGIARKLASYGPGTVFMEREI